MGNAATLTATPPPHQPLLSLSLQTDASNPATPTSPSGPAISSGIFIKHVLPDSPAGRAGGLFTGDRVLEISGVPLQSSDHTVAVGAIKAAGDTVEFLVQSLQDLRQQQPSPKVKKTVASTGKTSFN